MIGMKLHRTGRRTYGFRKHRDLFGSCTDEKCFKSSQDPVYLLIYGQLPVKAFGGRTGLQAGGAGKGTESDLPDKRGGDVFPHCRTSKKYTV